MTWTIKYLKYSWEIQKKPTGNVNNNGNLTHVAERLSKVDI